MTAWNGEIDLIDQIDGFAVFLNGETDVLEFEHR
jgi:hypothetical protein